MATVVAVPADSVWVYWPGAVPQLTCYSAILVSLFGFHATLTVAAWEWAAAKSATSGSNALVNLRVVALLIVGRVMSTRGADPWHAGRQKISRNVGRRSQDTQRHPPAAKGPGGIFSGDFIETKNSVGAYSHE